MQIYEIFELAKQKFKEKDYELSLKYFNLCKKYKEFYDNSLFEIIKIYFELKQYKKVLLYSKSYLKKSKNRNIQDNIKIFLAKTYKFLNRPDESIKILDSIKSLTILESTEFNEERLDVSYSLFNKYFRVNDFSGDIQLINREFSKIKNLIPNSKKILFYIIRISNFVHDYEFTKKMINKYKNTFPYRDVFYDNAILNEYEIASRKIRLKSKPRGMWIATSSKCNLSCIMCRAKESNFVLSKQNVRAIYDYMPYLEHIVWWGGEPTISNLFYEMLEYSLQYQNIHHTVITNGQYLPKKYLDLVSKNNIEVIVSIDSVDKTIYETVRKGASFDKLKENLSKLSKVLTPDFIGTNVVVMKQNKKQLKDICDFVSKFGIKKILFIPLANEGSRDNIELGDISLINRQIKNLKNVNLFDSISLIKNDKNNRSFLYGFCHNPWVEVTVSYSSTLVSSNLCEFFGIPVFKLTKQNMKKYWNSKIMQNLRKKIIKENCCSTYCPKAYLRLQ